MTGQGQGRKVFFFEKKKQKAFICSHLQVGRIVAQADANVQKFFGSFFQKRTLL
jgi:hypothetical protein